MKKLISLLLAAALVLSMLGSALAINNSGKIISVEDAAPAEAAAEEAEAPAEEPAEEAEAPAEEPAEEAESPAEEPAEEESTSGLKNSGKLVSVEDAAAEEAPAEEAEAPAEEAPAEDAPAEEAEAPAEEPAEEAEAPAEEPAEEAEAPAEEPAAPFAYIMYADAAWAKQYWGSDAEGVTAANAVIEGPGAYTVGLTFAEPAADLAFAALGIANGETAFPNYTIELKAIRVNGEEVAFTKGYTSSDDQITTRMNIFNEWVTDLPADARSFDGSIEGASPIIVDKAAFASVENVEVDFVLHKNPLDSAYIMYADAAWAKQYWGSDAEGVLASNAVIDGYGDYSVSLEFTEPAEGLAFAALGIVNGEKTYPGAYLEIREVRVNGEPIEVKKGYTSSDDQITTRMNLYNEWVTDLPADARSFDGSIEGAAPIIVDKEAFASVSSVEIDFTLHPVTDTAYIMYADAGWAKQYWFADAEGVEPANVTVEGPGTYTVGLTFAEPAEGLAFMAVGIVNGENTFGGYFVDVTDVKVNGESIAVGKGYTTSDDGITTRENLYNEWVTELPKEARRADGDLEGASSIVIDKEAFASVTSVEVTFNYIYGKPAEKSEDAPMSEDEAKALMAEGFHAYIGVQGTETYVFRNAWNDNYGLNDEENPFFYRLTGWDNNNAVDYGGTFADAEITADGEYTVSLTTGEMGFGTTQAFNLLFVSTDIPSKLVKDGFLTIENVRVKIGDAATREVTHVNTSGDYVMLSVIDTYNIGEAEFGYTVPGAGETISITFSVTGMDK